MCTTLLPNCVYLCLHIYFSFALTNILPTHRRPIKITIKSNDLGMCF